MKVFGSENLSESHSRIIYESRHAFEYCEFQKSPIFYNSQSLLRVRIIFEFYT